jgi:hypothetical protein
MIDEWPTDFIWTFCWKFKLSKQIIGGTIGLRMSKNWLISAGQKNTQKPQLGPTKPRQQKHSHAEIKNNQQWKQELPLHCPHTTQLWWLSFAWALSFEKAKPYQGKQGKQVEKIEVSVCMWGEFSIYTEELCCEPVPLVWQQNTKKNKLC